MTKVVDWKKHEEQSDNLESLDILDTDIKINPDYYVHLILVYATKALGDSNLNEGLHKFITLINSLETYANASKLLDDDYTEDIKKFKADKDIKIFENRVQLAHLKQELILTRLFESKTISTPMKLK